MPSRFVCSLIVLVFLATSCEKVLEVDVDSQKHLVVLNGVPSEGRQLFVNLAYSRFFLDTSIMHPINGATMTIAVNGTALTPNSVKGCNYFFPHVLQADDRLSISVHADGQDITAETYVPRPPQISNVEAHIDTTRALTLLNIDFDLADHSGYRDLYHFTVVRRDSGSRRDLYTGEIEQIDTVVNEMFICQEQDLSSPLVAASEPFAGYLFNRLLTTDSLIDGQNRHVRLMVIMFKDTTEIEPFIHDYMLDIETVTYDRYRYLQDVDKATSMVTIFTDPIPIYTNVKGAYGIFAGNARRQFALSPDTLAAPVAVSLPPTSEMRTLMRSALLNR